MLDIHYPKMHSPPKYHHVSVFLMQRYTFTVTRYFVNFPFRSFVSRNPAHRSLRILYIFRTLINYAELILSGLHKREATLSHGGVPQISV